MACDTGLKALAKATRRRQSIDKMTNTNFMMAFEARPTGSALTQDDVKQNLPELV